MQLKKEKFSGLLSQPDLVTKKAVIFAGIVFTVFSVATLWDLTQNPQLNQFVQRVGGLLTSIVAGLLFAYFYKKEENAQLEAIRGVGQKDLIEEVLREVAHYEGIYCEDHHMRAYLVPHPDKNDYFRCRISHSYKKSKVGRVIEFAFYRITKNSKPEDRLPAIADEALVREYVWFNDERDFPVEPNEDDYDVRSVLVGSIKYELQKKRVGEHIFFSCELPEPPEPFTPIRFDVTVPIERESILTLTSEFPSRGVEVEFEWKDVQNAAPGITVHPVFKLGLKTSPTELRHQETNLHVIHPGWALPKDSCVFSWWIPK